MKENVKTTHVCGRCNQEMVEVETTNQEDYTVHKCGCGTYYDLEKYTDTDWDQEQPV